MRFWVLEAFWYNWEPNPTKSFFQILKCGVLKTQNRKYYEAQMISHYNYQISKLNT